MKPEVIANGLKALIDDARPHTDIPCEKLHAMEAIYLRNSVNQYDAKEIDVIRHYLTAVTYKFHLANLALEQLWALSETKRINLLDALHLGIQELNVSDDEVLAISFVFEGFLLQARTFLDFFMLYIMLILKTGHLGSISRKKFDKALSRVKEGPFAEKALAVSDYFSSRVFGSETWDAFNPNNWGTLLVELRDKISHKDILRKSFQSDEELVGGVLFNWPTLQNITYDRFCQSMQNGMFMMLTDISPILFNLEWKSGPYREGLWEADRGTS